MKIELLFLGKTREKYLATGIEDYLKRLRRYTYVEIVVVKERINPSLSDRQQKERDAEVLLNRSSRSSIRVALDTQGHQSDSEGLARKIDTWEMRGVKSVSFLIGGHLGFAPVVLEKADYILSLSKLTFTHEMTRFLLVEQLYRAYSIKAGHNYHK